jgi:hypothetical protein
MHAFLPCPPPYTPIRLPRIAPIGGMTPSKPVGDPESLPPDPTPPQPYDPGDPVRAPRPREPDQPAIDPHDPGMPMPRIDDPVASAFCWFN